jgi:hypothetical protein
MRIAADLLRIRLSGEERAVTVPKQAQKVAEARRQRTGQRTSHCSLFFWTLGCKRPVAGRITQAGRAGSQN